MYIQGVLGGVYYTLGLGYDGEHLNEQDHFYCNFFEAFVVSVCFWYFSKDVLYSKTSNCGILNFTLKHTHCESN